MARRTLLNLDERILTWVVSEGAKKGLYGISTAHIAAQLRISEPLIFVHYQSKENLLKEAYRWALHGLYGSLSTPTNLENPRKNLMDGLSLYGTTALANPEKTRYVFFYESQSFPTPDPSIFLEETQTIVALFEAVKPFEKNGAALSALRHLLSNYAQGLCQQEIALDEKTVGKIIDVFVVLVD
jgi:AcrR family transcriptional regulator